MRICVLSMQQVNNMGSLLQAYALKSTIEELGHEVAFLDIHSNKEDNQLLNGAQLDFRTELGSQGIIGKINRIDKYLFKRILNKFLLQKQMDMYEAFRDKYIPKADSAVIYDVAVIGSDEVFNCMDSGNIGFTSQLFGNIPQANRVITYAASCGATSYELLPDKVENRIRKSFENISTFSVRDRNTKEFVSRLTDKEIIENLDPVLIYDFQNEIAAAETPELPDRYCVIYSYYNRINQPEEIMSIKAFCKKHNLKTLAIGAPQFWCDSYCPSSPFECLKIFQESSFVITDTFHGTILSVKYANKFAVLIRGSNRNKLSDLIERLEIGRHVLGSASELESVFKIEKDVDTLSQITNLGRQKGVLFLQSQIMDRPLN